MIHTDGVDPKDLVLTVAITIPKEDPRCRCPNPNGNSSVNSLTSWSASTIASLQSKETFVLQMSEPDHRQILIRLLKQVDTIIGQNIQFDVMCLRWYLPELRTVLNGRRHTLIDAQCLNHLHDPIRPERSLKSLGPIVGTHAYDDSDTIERFECRPSDPRTVKYNARDSTYTLQLAARLSQMILDDWPNTDKASSFCIQHFSDLIWVVIRMAESGLPVHRPSLERLESIWLRWMDVCAKRLERLFDLKVAGKGSVASRREFLRSVWKGDLHHDPVRAPDLELTPRKGVISYNDKNRNILREGLPPGDPREEAFRLWQKYIDCAFNYGHYSCPLLRHRTRAKKGRWVQDSVLIPQSEVEWPGGQSLSWANPEVWCAPASWFITPSPFKDDSALEGGTKQVRITCKSPDAQTWPPVVKACVESRFRNGIVISCDASQIELRVPAIMSGDLNMLHAYNTGEDIHKQMAVTMFSPTCLDHPNWKDNSKDDPRKLGKETNFLIVFRGGAMKLVSLCAEYGRVVPEQQAAIWINKAWQIRQGLRAWQDRLIWKVLGHDGSQKRVKGTGVVVLPFTGHSRRFSGGDKFEVNEICNSIVQMTAANVTLQMQIEIARQLPALDTQSPIRMFHQTYDSIYFDCAHPRYVDDVTRMVQNATDTLAKTGYWAMICDYYGHSVPLVYELEVNGEEIKIQGDPT